MPPATDVTPVTRQARGWKGTWLHDVNGGNAQAVPAGAERDGGDTDSGM
jgi:hypothetical protein